MVDQTVEAAARYAPQPSTSARRSTCLPGGRHVHRQPTHPDPSTEPRGYLARSVFFTPTLLPLGGAVSSPLTLVFGSVLVVFAGLTAHAGPAASAVPRVGSCPSGYSTSGDYCNPSSSARYAVPKVGSCPSGYSTSGNYCLASSDSSGHAVIKGGSCPSGYSTSGAYCLSH